MFKVSYKIHTTLRYFKKTIYFYIRKVRQNKIITKVICMLLPVKTKVEFPVQITQHEDDKFS